jgi:hypothetical protein
VNVETALVGAPASVLPACGHIDAVHKIVHQVPLPGIFGRLFPTATRSLVYCGPCVGVVDSVIRDYRSGVLDLADFEAVSQRLAPLAPRHPREVRRFIRQLRKEAA